MLTCYDVYTCIERTDSVEEDMNIVWVAKDSNPKFLLTFIVAPILMMMSMYKSYTDKFPSENRNSSSSDDSGAPLVLLGIMVIVFTVTDIIISGGLAWNFDLSFSLGDLKIVPSVISVQAFLTFLHKGVKIGVKWRLRNK